jgi:hypothetical protein
VADDDALAVSSAGQPSARVNLASLAERVAHAARRSGFGLVSVLAFILCHRTRVGVPRGWKLRRVENAKKALSTTHPAAAEGVFGPGRQRAQIWARVAKPVKARRAGKKLLIEGIRAGGAAHSQPGSSNSGPMIPQ